MLVIRKREMTHEENIKLLTDAGLSQNDAEVVIDCFETADLYGVTTHGISMLPLYLERIKRGGYNLHPDIRVINETPAFALVDGANGIGSVVANYCMNYAITKSKDVGIFTVLSRNNNTFGPAFYYPLKAAEQGMIGLICSNSPAQMAPAGGIDKMLGTNPFAAVIPVPGTDPIIIDMATSVVAKSKFKDYKERGLLLPEGWALDKNGNPTTDPNEAIQGLVLPMAGYKGYGIAMLIDILAGVLSGAAFLNHVGRFYDSCNKSMNVGFFVISISPKVVLGDSYDKMISEFVAELRNSHTLKDKIISLPGDDRIRYKNEKKRKNGKAHSDFQDF